MKLTIGRKIALTLFLLIIVGVNGFLCVLILGVIPGVIAAIILPLIFVLLLWNTFFKPLVRKNRLEKTGIRTTALIKEIHETGITINQDPVPRFILEIKSLAGDTYIAEATFQISRLQIGMFQPGNTIPVLADPNQPNKVTLDTGEA